MSGPRGAEREIEALERELDDPDLTPEERREIHRRIRDVEREEGEREAWEEQGRERGWSPC